MTAAELVLSFRQARNYHAGRVDTPRFIIVHFAVTAELNTSAEGVQTYFATTQVQASAHITADDDSLVRSVHDWDTAWAAPGCNADGLHLEQAGKGQTRAQWLDKYSRKMIEEQSAKAVADWSVRHSIPLVKRGPADILANRGGVAGHVDVTHAYPKLGDHTDPGPDYPYDVLLGAAREHTIDVKRPTVHHNPFPVPTTTFTAGCSDDHGATVHPTAPNWTRVHFVRWALSLPLDNHFGSVVLAAVKAFQAKHGLAADGICGPHTLAVMATITRRW